MAQVRIVVADDHAVVREGIRSMLESSAELTIVGEAANGAEALALVEAHEPDVVVLDISMPGMSGLEVVAALRERGTRPGVLILSMYDHAEYVLEAVRSGADGYLLKSAGPAEVRRAVRAIARGERVFGPDVARVLGAAVRTEAIREGGRARLEDLTPREREVLTLVAAGRTSREIGDTLGISHRTVETHRESLMRKLDIHTVAGLTRFAIDAGVLDD